jgi:hypothetical protein
VYVYYECGRHQNYCFTARILFICDESAIDVAHFWSESFKKCIFSILCPFSMIFLIVTIKNHEKEQEEEDATVV